ncbi:hypothetical protein ACFVZD_46875 [Streptomyces sp. NPDC058287]|uniref:hypothetical protein n=1 Tax=unclassified Streptomyces TaxID=2593676 RepID=UPI0036E76719
MSETYRLDCRRRRRWPTLGNRGLFGALLALDAVVTLFPPLYWAAGANRSAAAALLYFIGGGAVVLVSILVMYAVDGAQAKNGGPRS